MSVGASPPLRFVAGNASAAKLEWTGAMAFVVLATVAMMRPFEQSVLLVTVAVAPIVAWIVVQDVLSFTIADGAIVGLAALAIAVRVTAGDPALVIGLDVLLTGGVLLAFREAYYRVRGTDGLGLGDVKLAAASGLLVGAQAFALALLAASALALGGVLVARLVRRSDPSSLEKIAFGAALAPIVYVVWLVEALPVVLPTAS